MSVSGLSFFKDKKIAIRVSCREPDRHQLLWRRFDNIMQNKSKSSFNSVDYELSGPVSIRQFFFPKQRLLITDIAPFIGICRSRIYKRVKSRQLKLRIQYDATGLPFVTLDALVQYLYPSNTSPSTPPAPPHKMFDQPRKSVEGCAR